MCLRLDLGKFVHTYIYIYIELNYTQNKLLLGTAVSAFTTRSVSVFEP